MKKQTLLFVDNTYPKPYQVSTLKEKAIGGTESSVIKTALILSKVYRVFVAQEFRTDFCVESGNLNFIPKKHINKLAPDFIVILRKFPLLKGLRKQFPKARLFLWLHTYKNTEYVFKRLTLAKTNTTVICNSKTHAIHTADLLNNNFFAHLFSHFVKKAKVNYCYNPVSMPEKQANIRDINKLLFFSSPNKGLQQVVSSFIQIIKALPDLRLYIANPGYKSNQSITFNANIIVIGSLPHAQMMKHVAQSLCVFYPQDTFAETFGLIYAEANAYGTPVLAHNIGSAKEILDKNNGLIDANNIKKIIETIKTWQNVFPEIKYNKKFSSKFILNQWINLFS